LEIRAFRQLAQPLQSEWHDPPRVATHIREGDFTMKSIVIVSAIALTTLATPALAQPEGTFGRAKVSYDARTDSYCFREAPAGSLVPRTDCRSKAEWAQAGLTISHKATVQMAQR